MSKDFTDKVYWITGASGALGGRVASDLAAKGAIVIGSSRKGPDQLILKDGVRWLATDVTDRASVQKASDLILSEFGRVDGLVTSTNIPLFGDFLELSDEDWLAVINAKLLGSLRPLRALGQTFEKQGEGSIVFISGTGRGYPPSLKHLAGGGMNATLNFLVPPLAARFGNSGIRVNAVAPGPINSPRSDVMKKIGSGGSPIKLNRQGFPEDVSEAVLYLLSPASRFVTGVTIPVDGGGRL